jgi:phosphoglycolate phosphatase-like HAD superfamily hydrolase
MQQHFLQGTQIEIIREPARGAFRHALLDFDGTVSLLRQGWPEVMLPVMLESICGDTPPTPEIERACRDYIHESTGINTIIQMEHLVQMVRDHGLEPEDRILDAHGYKAVYNDRLMEIVNERIARLARGELSLDEATVKGSVGFVKALHDRGLAMYVFSGTDQPDVRNEAGLCGVAGYFREIHGALRTYAESNKEMILKKLITGHDLHGSEVLVVGDGPVEIRHGRENGCVTLGVCSDEAGNDIWDMVKRERLIQAGADLLVPHFGEAGALLNYLFPST